ncbi:MULTISPECIES: 4-(cytidine 5'-diphospho)-2-C-methyl-D-erythritol kinase [unclassified Meiothermus]|uniref:4-(cytidine 5'-diphospho)-2-C-methyl-D-erythritol kinase n=1 Tax=unclassified Meiothermus TaxID=370471 RepID=UPI0013EA7546|nr:MULTISPECIES: 4-(cytidine 5'-diphospho)-2-C-methyl-D-erythritol kinase [unclassified Meiothermus]
MERFSPAKVNLGLSVLGRRADGYHQLHTLFAALDVGDRIALEPVPQGVHLEVRGADLPTGPGNLAYRAAQAYLEAAGNPGGVRMLLEKRLPVAAGLGGGSGNAATVLLGLRQLYPAPLDLFPIARALGADVPFFLRGGLAEARGIGEVLSPLEPLRLHLVLVNPGLAVSATEAYQVTKPDDYAPELPVAAILAALKGGEEPPWWNSLEAPVFRLRPELAELKAALRAFGLRGVLMSGSGSTFLALASDPAQAQHLAARLRERFPRFWIRPAQSA